MRTLIWHRNDLRLHDNPLYSNLKANSEVIPVFVFNPELLESRQHGFARMGPFRHSFLAETIEDLKASLIEIGLKLQLFTGRPGELIPQLVRNLKIDEVWATKEHTAEEVSDEREVGNHIAPARLRLYDDRTLIQPDRLPFAVGHLPDVFTEFRKKVEGYSGISALLVPMLKVHPIEDPGHSESLTDLSGLSLQKVQPDARAGFRFKGGEREALKRLNDYFFENHHVATYKETRNGLLGANYSTRFSPWLANGSLSPRLVYHELRRYENIYGSSQNTYWVFFELLWRDYSRFVSMKYGNRIFKPRGLRNHDHHCLRKAEVFEKWRTGNTGSDFVDANMRELLLTGWMSNRGRQNVASYLIKDLGLCWLDGAAWFESQLIDNDVCNNYFNWMYLAGVGNDPRENSYFSIPKQAQMYDPDYAYRRLWLNKQMSGTK